MQTTLFRIKCHVFQYFTVSAFENDATTVGFLFRVVDSCHVSFVVNLIFSRSLSLELFVLKKKTVKCEPFEGHFRGFKQESQQVAAPSVLTSLP